MNPTLILVIVLNLTLSTAVTTLGRSFIKDFKAGMLVTLFANIINLTISSLITRKRVYYDTYILLVSTCFTPSTVLYFVSMYLNISGVTYSNYYSLRIVGVSLFSYLIMNRRYTRKQILGKILIMLGVSIQFISDTEHKIHYNVSAALLAGMVSALSTVIFECKVKERIHGLWPYLFTFNLCNIPLNFITSYIEYHHNKYAENFNMISFFVLVLMNVVSSLLSLYVSLHCDSFERTMVSNTNNLISSIISDWYLSFSLNTMSLISFFLVATGIYLYIYFKKIPNNCH